MTDKAPSDLWWKNAIVYCVDLAFWLDSDDDGIGDLAGLTRRLDYLNGLGVNCLWLMPFYPSPLRDDGYDITDYYTVDPRFGTLGDFVEMLRTADNLGIRVLVDLVLNHTSDEHRWFRDRHDFYVWSDRERDEPSEVAFPGEQDGTWTYDEAVGQWYMHRYYDFMPDLDITRPEVRDEMNKILGFWLELGISGFRVDSLPFLIETVGTDSRDNPVTYLKSLVEFMGRRKGDAIFLGEANVAPEEQQRYLGMDGGEGVQMLFDFRGCAAQWLSHARGDSRPLAEALRSRPKHPQHGQFANMCRHHDELNLGGLKDDEREEVFAAFAPEETHRVYDRGIRRRLAPMLGNDPRRIRLVLARTFALPGTPVLQCGDEIGLGGALSLHGRLAVRAPMQRSARAGGGFSRAGDLYRPVHADGEYGYREVNVVAQRHDPESLVSWTTRAIQVRRECPEMGWGEWEILDVGDSRVLALAYRWRDGRVVTLHNLSADGLRVRLPQEAGLSGVEEIRQMFGDVSREGGAELELGGYGYSWLRLLDAHATTAIV